MDDVQPENAVRQRSKADYLRAIETAKTFLIQKIEEQPDAPVLELTQSLYDSGSWKIPPFYQEIVIDAFSIVLGRTQYEMSNTQLLYAFVEAAQHCQKLRIDGVLLPKQQP